MTALCLSACSTSEPENAVEIEHALYLRGEMNDYAVSETYRLREEDEGLCTLATLRSDWSPYRFKFADAQWSAGHSFGYKEPPGVLRPHSGPLALNPDSKFEDISFYPEEDGVYRFCLIERDGEFLVTVDRTEQTEFKFLSQAIERAFKPDE